MVASTQYLLGRVCVCLSYSPAISPHCTGAEGGEGTPVLEIPVLEIPVLEISVLETPVLETLLLETSVPETPVPETLVL